MPGTHYIYTSIIPWVIISTVENLGKHAKLNYHTQDLEPLLREKPLAGEKLAGSRTFDFFRANAFFSSEFELRVKEFARENVKLYLPCSSVLESAIDIYVQLDLEKLDKNLLSNVAFLQHWRKIASEFRSETGLTEAFSIFDFLQNEFVWNEVEREVNEKSEAVVREVGNATKSGVQIEVGKGVKDKVKNGAKSESKLYQARLARQVQRATVSIDLTELDENNIDESLNSSTASPNSPISAKLLCYLCCERERNMLYRPCNHLVSCDWCHIKIYRERLVRCPTCRTVPTEFIKIFV